jgi:hypothetical protein
MRKFSLVWITKAFNLELLNLWERGKPQNKTSKKRAVTHDAHKLLLEEQESLHEAYPRTQRNAATAPLGNLA